MCLAWFPTSRVELKYSKGNMSWAAIDMFLQQSLTVVWIIIYGFPKKKYATFHTSRGPIDACDVTTWVYSRRLLSWNADSFSIRWRALFTFQKQTPAPLIHVSNLLMNERLFQIRQVNNKRGRWSFPVSASGTESFSVLISLNEPKTLVWMDHSPPGHRVLLVAFQMHVSSPRSKNRQKICLKRSHWLHFLERCL